VQQILLTRQTDRQLDQELAALHAAQRRTQRWFASDTAKLHRMLADGYDDVLTGAFQTVADRPAGPALVR
jgi:hypothetical protein